MYQIIDNVNDRSVLVLLENIRDRNKKEQRKYDNFQHKLWIIERLIAEIEEAIREAVKGE